jgi:hypothetical protein
VTIHQLNPSNYTTDFCRNIQAGDVLEFGPGEYLNQRIGIKPLAEDVALRGILGPNGERPHLHLQALTGKILPPDFGNVWGGAWQGRGIVVVKAKRCTIENMEFSGAKSNSFNGAGIRHESRDITVRNCFFHDNENGILGSEKDDPTTSEHDGGMDWIENCHFLHNGYGTGQAHNVYISRAETCVFVGNISEAAKVGHLFKTRAQKNIIGWNVLRDGDGNPSYAMDIDGGLAIIIGNDVEKTPNASNPSRMINYYLWHDQMIPNALYVLRNRLKCLDDNGGSFVKADDRIIIDPSPTTYGGTGTIIGRIAKNVAIYSARMNAAGTAPFKTTYGIAPFKVPATVIVADDNIVVPVGKEPPPAASVPYKLTPETLADFIASITQEDDDLMYKEQAEALTQQLAQLQSDFASAAASAQDEIAAANSRALDAATAQKVAEDALAAAKAKVAAALQVLAAA